MAGNPIDQLPWVYIFWDNSNVFISARRLALDRDGILDSDIRIHFENLYKLASGGRKVRKAVAVGSVPPELRDVWRRLSEANVTIELYERGAGTGTEQGMDQCLQVHMLRAITDEASPQVAVVLTGDGAGYGTGAGFWADLERMHKKGWGVEVLSWNVACHKGLKSWAMKNGVYVELEKHYEAVTFINGGRPAKPLTMKHRPFAVPNPNRKV